MCRVGGFRVCARAGCLSSDAHGASSSRLKSAPTHANRFGEGFIFVEIRFGCAGFGGSTVDTVCRAYGAGVARRVAMGDGASRWMGSWGGRLWEKRWQSRRTPKVPGGAVGMGAIDVSRYVSLGLRGDLATYTLQGIHQPFENGGFRGSERVWVMDVIAIFDWTVFVAALKL
jgi:hypothetical protein